MTSASAAANRRRLARPRRGPAPAQAPAAAIVGVPVTAAPSPWPSTIAPPDPPDVGDRSLDDLVGAVQETATKLDFMILATMNYCELWPGYNQGDSAALGMMQITETLSELSTALREHINDLTSVAYQPGARVVVDHSIRPVAAPAPG